MNQDVRNLRIGRGIERRAQGARLAALRIFAQFKTASAAARAMKIATPTYLAHENGTRKIRDDMATGYAMYYGKERGIEVSPEWILYGTGNGISTTSGDSNLSNCASENNGLNLAARYLAQIEQMLSGFSPVDKIMLLAGIERIRAMLSQPPTEE